MEPQTERIPRDIWVLIASAFVIAIGFGFITPIMPEYASSFGVNATLVTVVVSAFAAFRLLFAPTSGRLVTRWGERWVYLTGVLLVAASSAATAFAQTYVQLLVLRSIGGIGSTMFTVSAFALIVKLAPATIRGRVSSAYASSFLVGGIAGPLLGGILHDQFGVRVPFLAYAALLVVAAFLVGFFIKKPAPGSTGAGSGQGVPITFRWAVRDSAYVAALVTSFVNGWANFGFRFAITPLFVASFSPNPARDAGLALSALAVGNVIGISVTGRFTDRWGRRPFLISGLAISAGGTLATAFVDHIGPLLLWSVLAGIGAGAMNPAMQAALADVMGKGSNAAPALAAAQMAGDLGTIIGPVLAGAVVDLWGFQSAFVMTALVATVPIVWWWRGPETLGRAPLAQPTAPVPVA